MATELQELVLTVNLEDNASAQLGRLRSQMEDLGSPQVMRGLKQFNQEIDANTKKIAEMLKGVLGLGRTFEQLKAVFNPTTLFLGAMGFEAVRINSALTEQTRALVEMGNKAKLASSNFGEYRNFLQQLHRMGIQASDAQEIINGLSQTAADLARGPFSQIRQQLAEHMFTPEQLARMNRWIDSYIRANSAAERANLVRKAQQDAFNEAYKEAIANGASDLAAQAEGNARATEFLGIVNQTNKFLQINQKIRVPNADDLRRQNEMNEHAKAYLETSESIAERWEDIKLIMSDAAFGPNSPMLAMMTKVDEFLNKWDEQLKKARDDIRDFPPPPNLSLWQRLDPRNPSRSNIYKPGAPGNQVAPPSSFLAPGTLGSLPTAFQHGGIVTQPTHALIGEAGPEAVVPLSGQAGYEAQKKVASLEENTDEVKSLNQSMDDLLDTLEKGDKGWGPGSGVGAGGGYGGGGTGGGGGGGTGRGTGTGRDTGTTLPPPPPPMGASGAPLGGVMGGKPFGINVSDSKFTEITGLPPSFKNVSAGQREYARQISTGTRNIGLGGEFTGQKTEAGAWPVAADTGGGGGGTGGGTIDRSKWRAYLAAHPEMKERILQIMNNEQGGSKEGMQGVAETIFNRADFEKRDLTEKRSTGWVSEGGYYADGNKGRGMNRADAEAALEGALSGSDVAKGGTENSSGSYAARQLAKGEFTLATKVGRPGAQETLQTPGTAGGARSTPQGWQKWYAGAKRAPTSVSATATPSPVTVSPITAEGAGPAGTTGPATPGVSTPGVKGALYDPVTAAATAKNPLGIGSRWGEPRPGHIHQGDDIYAPSGSPMYAAKDGVIRSYNLNGALQPNTPSEPSASHVLRVDWDDGTWSYYMHGNLDSHLKPGDRVKGGQQIGTSGRANSVDHLHFEMHTGPGAATATSVEPIKYFGWDAKNPSVGGKVAPSSQVQVAAASGSDVGPGTSDAGKTDSAGAGKSNPTDFPKNAPMEHPAETVKRVQEIAQGKAAPTEPAKSEAVPEAAKSDNVLVAAATEAGKKMQFGGMLGPMAVLPLTRNSSVLDTIMRQAMGVGSNTFNFKINHKNAPPGVALSTSGDLFKNVEVVKQIAFNAMRMR